MQIVNCVQIFLGSTLYLFSVFNVTLLYNDFIQITSNYVE